MKTITLNFRGYWIEATKGSIPKKSGVYCVYAGTYNHAKGNVSLRELIYVGESEDVRTRLENHERQEDWEKLLRAGETLCYSMAEMVSDDRVRAEAAVIHRHKPPCNREYVSRFPFATTTIKTSGWNYLLKTEFTVFTKR